MSPMQYAKLPQNSESEVIRSCAESLENKVFMRFLKRTGDIFVSLVLLVLLSPVLLILSVWILLDSPGGVLFRQERVGLYEKPFTILKFRTMRANNTGSQITVDDDDRITRVGRLIRSLRLDEFPQLINVLRGDMSLVGPRPEVKKFVDKYQCDDFATLLVRPGVTCRSSIAFANEAEILPKDDTAENYYIERILPAKCAMNVEYVRRLSIFEDIAIIFSTVMSLFKQKTGDRNDGENFNS